jgi:hypothetical protein
MVMKGGMKVGKLDFQRRHFRVDPLVEALLQAGDFTLQLHNSLQHFVGTWVPAYSRHPHTLHESEPKGHGITWLKGRFREALTAVNLRPVGLRFRLNRTKRQASVEPSHRDSFEDNIESFAVRVWPYCPELKPAGVVALASDRIGAV